MAGRTDTDKLPGMEQIWRPMDAKHMESICRLERARVTFVTLVLLGLIYPHILFV